MAILPVASIDAGSPDAHTFTTSAIDTTGADLLAVLVSDVGSGTLTDSKGNTWNILTQEPYQFSGRAFIAYALNPTVGSGHTFTLTSVNNFGSLCATAWSGADTTAPFDIEDTFHADGVTAIKAGAVTPSQDGSLILTGVGLRGLSAGAVASVDSGFTLEGAIPQTAAHFGMFLGYLIQGTAAAVDPQFTWSGADGAGAVTAVFKPAAGGGGGSIAITPAASETKTTTVNPTVILGSLAITPAASSARTSTVNPVVRLGSLAITPAASNTRTSTAGPTVLAGGLVFTPAASSVRTSTVNPTVILGSLAITPAASSARTSTVNPSLFFSSMAFTPAASNTRTSTAGPNVLVGSGVSTNVLELTTHITRTLNLTARITRTLEP